MHLIFFFFFFNGLDEKKSEKVEWGRQRLIVIYCLIVWGGPGERQGRGSKRAPLGKSGCVKDFHLTALLSLNFQQCRGQIREGQLP